MEIKIISKPAFTVAGMPYFGKNENSEIPPSSSTTKSSIPPKAQAYISTSP